MKKPHPQADPQFWANREHLQTVLSEQGPDASTKEFARMQQGHLPVVEDRHRQSANGYRRWNHLPPLSPAEASVNQTVSPATPTHAK